MDLPSEDLDKYVEKFELVFSNQKLNKKNQNDLLGLIENLSSELRICRKTSSVLKNNFNKIAKSDDKLSLKYINLEEKFVELQNENKLLIKQKEELNVLMQNELEMQKNDYLSKIKDLQEKSQSEITNLNNLLDNAKICNDKREAEIYNEMQMSFALEWAEKESEFKNQLEDARKNLRHCQNSACRLRCEVNYLRNQLNNQNQKDEQNQNTLHFKETPIQQIKNKLMQKQFYGQEIYNSESFEVCNQNEPETTAVVPSTEHINNALVYPSDEDEDYLLNAQLLHANQLRFLTINNPMNKRISSNNPETDSSNNENRLLRFSNHQDLNVPNTSSNKFLMPTTVTHTQRNSESKSVASYSSEFKPEENLNSANNETKPRKKSSNTQNKNTKPTGPPSSSLLASTAVLKQPKKLPDNIMVSNPGIHTCNKGNTNRSNAFESKVDESKEEEKLKGKSCKKNLPIQEESHYDQIKDKRLYELSFRPMVHKGSVGFRSQKKSSLVKKEEEVPKKRKLYNPDDFEHLD